MFLVSICFKRDLVTLKEYKQLLRPSPKSKMAEIMSGKFKFRFSKWKLPFYPCYHAFLRCLIVKEKIKIWCVWAINPNFRLSADGPIILLLEIQYTRKKRCRNCQEHEEMKRLLKQKLKEQLKRTSQTPRNKGSRTFGLGFSEIV